MELYFQECTLAERWQINFSLHKKHLAQSNNQICFQDGTQKPLFFRRTFPQTQIAMVEIFAGTLSAKPRTYTFPSAEHMPQQDAIQIQEDSHRFPKPGNLSFR